MSTDAKVSQSTINYFPRNNNVIVKISFELSTMAVVTNKPIEGDETNKVFEIVGIGPMVNGLEIGDKVQMIVSEGYEALTIPENKSSLRELQKTYASMSNQERSAIIHNKETSRVTIVEYGIFPEFQIKVVIKNEN